MNYIVILFYAKKILKGNVMNKEIIFCKPIFKQMLWGGNELQKKFGYDIPGDDTGECWGISAHENGDCEIASGEYAGIKLSELFSTHKRDLFGNIDYDKFPLLVKIIDAKDDLSIQVHPNDEYAKINENGAYGKTECWYILDCKEDATIVIGHYAKTKQEMKEMIQQGKWKSFIREIPIKKGDFFQIEPGTLHAIKGGTIILETQQNSDITYRVYDYDRLQNGVKRPLHIEKSIDVITVPFNENEDNNIKGRDKNPINQLENCDFYDVYKIDVNGKEKLHITAPFLLMSVIEGNGKIDGIPINKGQHFILPNGYNDFVIEGDISIISSTAKNR